MFACDLSSRWNHCQAITCNFQHNNNEEDEEEELELEEEEEEEERCRVFTELLSATQHG